MTKISKKAKWLAALMCVFGLAAVVAATPDIDDTLTGGATTVHAQGRNAFSFPLANLSDEERTRFAIGNSFFRRNWVEAPASTKARDGLGPHFIARSCGGCHVQDGRGAPPEVLRGGRSAEFAGLLLRLSVPGSGDHGAVLPEPIYGDQLNNLAIQGVAAEGRPQVTYAPLKGRFPDGERYALLQPIYRIGKLGYGAMSKDVLVSPRVAPHLAGVGLLEAIDEADILANVQAQRARSDAIRGKANRVWDAFAQQVVLGRFGWKANVGSLAHQTAGAFLGDIGITSSIFPSQACTASQPDCARAVAGGQPEIDDETLANVTFYQSALAPAARREAKHPEVLKGEKLFHSIQCAACHRPSYQTAGPLFPKLSSPAVEKQVIWPYTDLLLHDMGPGLADKRPDFLANGRQWKTPPLWGIGLIKDVNGHQRLMHDGRARGVQEAILWHGGQAQASRSLYMSLKKFERQALLRFVNSL